MTHHPVKLVQDVFHKPQERPQQKNDPQIVTQLCRWVQLDTARVDLKLIDVCCVFFLNSMSMAVLHR